MSDENNYTEKAKLNRVLGIAKVLYKTNPVDKSKSSYDEGEEVDVEWMDREGDWTILDVQQISEDVNRVKEVMGLITEQENDCKNSDEAKKVKIKAEDDFIKDYKEKNPGKTIIFIDVVNAGNDAVEEFCKNRLNESKMSKIDLEGYKKKSIEEGNNEWVEILDRFPDEFQREIIDERPEGSKSDINLIGNWELDPNYPITMNLLNLLQTKSVKEAIGRTPRHVMEMIKTNPMYRLELEDVEHVSDTKIGREFGLKSGEIFDRNPERYEEYANYDPETAEPSTMVNGELYWGMGRLIAALLRGDMTIKVWSITT